jgi:hypothetical protein
VWNVRRVLRWHRHRIGAVIWSVPAVGRYRALQEQARFRHRGYTQFSLENIGAGAVLLHGRARLPGVQVQADEFTLYFLAQGVTGQDAMGIIDRNAELAALAVMVHQPAEGAHVETLQSFAIGHAPVLVAIGEEIATIQTHCLAAQCRLAVLIPRRATVSQGAASLEVDAVYEDRVVRAATDGLSIDSQPVPDRYLICEGGLQSPERCVEAVPCAAVITVPPEERSQMLT